MTQTIPLLPVDKILPQLQQLIAQGVKSIVIKASPGSGKTTRIPPYLMRECQGQVWVLEPRRLAAKLSAQRVQEELNCLSPSFGEAVGWQMRDDTKITEKTKLLFLTEGMLPLRLLESPNLDGVSCLVIDEFHERHAQTDLAFALARNLQKTTRPDLILIVMSATLDTAKLTQLMPEAKSIDIEAPVFPVETLWWKGDPQKSLIEKVTEGVANLSVQKAYSGHILVFLPGTRDIELCAEALRRSTALTNIDAKWTIIELRATISRDMQLKAFEDSPFRKIILATNIAESAITIPGVTGVIDSGLARVPSFSSTTQLSTLETRQVSQASLIQRAGRAGRTGPGIVLRLFTEQDYAARAAMDLPEILRVDLSSFLLNLWGIRKRIQAPWQPWQLDWPDSPSTQAWGHANELLLNLNLVRRSTPQKSVNHDSLDPNAVQRDDFEIVDDRYAKWPLHPRSIRFLSSCLDAGITHEGLVMAAILSDEQVSIETPRGSESIGCDLLARYELIERDADNPKWRSLKRTVAQLKRDLRIADAKRRPFSELNLDKPLLDAFGDRIAKPRKPYHAHQPREFSLCGGGDALVPAASAAISSDWIIAWRISNVRTTGSAQSALGDSQRSIGKFPLIEGGSGIDLTSLLTIKTWNRTETTQIVWDENSQKVRCVERVNLGILVLSERRLPLNPENKNYLSLKKLCEDLLEKKILESWPKPFANEDSLKNFVLRQNLLHQHGFAEHKWDFAELKALLIASMVEGAEGFSDIEKKSLDDWIRDGVGYDEWTQVETLAPSKIKIGAGFMTPVCYEDGRSPWMEARLQNFYGQTTTPKILSGKVPLTLHLLAPNQVALQVTTDLESFWKNTYPTLRNEYMRKYPRHVWAENPIEAAPPARGSLKPRVPR